MTLQSSGIHNYSWTVNEILITPFCSSSCCQTYFPSIVRPMNKLWKLILKMFFTSLELNRSVFSMHLLRMTTRCNTFFDTSYSEKYFLDSISIQFLLSMGTVIGEKPAGALLCDCAFYFDRHAIAFAISFNEFFSSWSSGILVQNFCFIVQIHLKLFWSVRNFGPGVSVVHVQRHNSDLNSLPCK